MKSFTICSNNYLAQALTLGDSLVANGLKKENFIIFLCDIKSKDIDYEGYNFLIIEINDEIVPKFTELTKKYDIIELNTSVKPSIFKYLINNVKEDHYCYLDPDLFFYQNIDLIKNDLAESSILLTPHILEPVPLNFVPSESTFLNYGLYNLGFLMLKNDFNSLKMLNWWEERTLNSCFNNPSQGIFVDQLWINLVPIYFKGVKISSNYGLNVAYWNLNERSISMTNNTYLINSIQSLIFFHFSSFDLSLRQISKRGSLFDKEQYQTVYDMMKNYREKLLQYPFFKFKEIKPSYEISFEEYLFRKLPQKRISTKELLLIRLLNKILPKKMLQSIVNLKFKMDLIDSYTK